MVGPACLLSLAHSNWIFLFVKKTAMLSDMGFVSDGAFLMHCSFKSNRSVHYLIKWGFIVKFSFRCKSYIIIMH